jgi:hypothetical protein
MSIVRIHVMTSNVQIEFSMYELYYDNIGHSTKEQPWELPEGHAT